LSKPLAPSASSSLESIVPALPEPEVGSDKKTERPEPARVHEAPQVLRRAPGKIPKWLKLPGITKSGERSPTELHRNTFSVDAALEDVSRRLAGHVYQCLSVTNYFVP